MTSALAMLMAFNSLVAQYRAVLVPEARIFVGAQVAPADDSGAYAWTKCVPESGAFVMQLGSRFLEAPKEQQDEYSLRRLAGHEVCHVQLHGRLMCAPAMLRNTDGEWVMTPAADFAVQSAGRQKQMEIEADRCAVELLAREHGDSQ